LLTYKGDLGLAKPTENLADIDSVSIKIMPYKSKNTIKIVPHESKKSPSMSKIAKEIYEASIVLSSTAVVGKENPPKSRRNHAIQVKSKKQLTHCAKIAIKPLTTKMNLIFMP
jgi:hypothetical protein